MNVAIFPSLGRGTGPSPPAVAVDYVEVAVDYVYAEDTPLCTAPTSLCGSVSCSCLDPAETLCQKATTQSPSNVCSFLTMDVHNCGACGHNCPAGAACTGGACQCPGAETACNGVCIDLMSDAANCGACGSACLPGTMCVGGTCAVMLSGCRSAADCVPQGMPYCNPASAMCAPCASNADCSCTQVGAPDGGGCPTAGTPYCSAEGVCIACVDDGQCTADALCLDGACQACPPNSVCDGICTDLSNDPNNCGSCFSTCPSGSGCVDGSCCLSNAICSGICVNLGADPDNCGVCGNKCPPAAPWCIGSTCTPCPSGSTYCADACTDTAIDSDNCGACGVVCPANSSCANGVCCGAGYAGSFEDLCSGICTNIGTDPNNCGMCGRVCPQQMMCEEGLCYLPNGGSISCSVCRCDDGTCSTDLTFENGAGNCATGYNCLDNQLICVAECACDGRHVCSSANICEVASDWGTTTAPSDTPDDSQFTVLCPDAGGADNCLVTDGLTGLSWQQTVSPDECRPGGCTWPEAESYCAGLDYGGFNSGWRLPSMVELLSITNLTPHLSEGINGNLFPNTTPAYFWTSSPGGNGLWGVNFAGGIPFTEDNTPQAGYLTYPDFDAGDLLAVRCVR